MTHPQTGQITNLQLSRLLTFLQIIQSSQLYWSKFQTSMNLNLTITPTLGNSSHSCRLWETRNSVSLSLIHSETVSSSSPTTPPNRRPSWMPFCRYSGPYSCAWSSQLPLSTSSMMQTNSSSTPLRECLRRWDWSRRILWQPPQMRCSRPVSCPWSQIRKRTNKVRRLRRKSRRRGRHSSRIRKRLITTSSTRLRSSRKLSSRSAIC